MAIAPCGTIKKCGKPEGKPFTQPFIQHLGAVHKLRNRGWGGGKGGGSDQLITLLHWGREIYFGQAHFDGQRQCIDGMLVAFKRNKLTKLGRYDRTAELLKLLILLEE